jgi:hypothetical protein
MTAPIIIDVPALGCRRCPLRFDDAFNHSSECRALSVGTDEGPGISFHSDGTRVTIGTPDWCPLDTGVVLFRRKYEP